MSSPRSLLPDFIVLQQVQGRQHGVFPAHTLFIDLSGFTALTETLMQEGAVGAERLSGILNDIFSPLVHIIYEEGGFIPYFAGDAFTAIFPKQEMSLEHCLRSALRIRRVFHERQCHFGGFEIGYKMGLGRGNVEWGIVGGELKSWYFRGPAIEESLHCQAKAGSRQVVLKKNFAKDTVGGFGFRAMPGEEGGYLLLEQSAGLPDLPVAKRQSLPEEVFQEVVSQFLTSGLLEFQAEGEFRSVVSVFCAFRQIETHEQLDYFVSAFLRRIRHFGGYFKEIDYGDKGGLLLAFFGAPVTYENNLQRALEFVLTLREDWRDMFGESHYRMGITDGIAFTGFIGGRERCQYAVVGRHVNLAARLMTKAPWGSMLTDEGISKNKLFSFRHRGDIRYKGIMDKVPTYELLGRKSAEEFPFEGPLIGREEEQEEILHFAREHHQRGEGAAVILLGEAGTGKSRLAWEVCKRLEGEADWLWLYGPADQILHKPFYPFVRLLQRYFGLQEGMSSARRTEQFDRGFRQMLSEVKEAVSADEIRRLEPAYRALLELPQADGRWEQLDSRSRHQSVLAALQAFFLVLAQERSYVLELDDLQSIDPESEDFLLQLLPLLSRQPVLLVLNARYDEEGKPPALLKGELPLPVKTIELGNLSAEHLRLFAESKLGGPVSEEFIRLLERTTNGNPFYLEQLLAYFRESELLAVEADGKWNVLDQNVRLSHSVHAILTARLDRLSSMVRETVKAAAVIGREFELPVLTEVMKGQLVFGTGREEPLTSGILKEQVDTAEKVQIWRAVNELRYMFKHSLLREAVYEMQLRARLKQLHQLIAEAIEKVHAEDIDQYLADLVYHYEQAGDLVKARLFAKRAADAFRSYYQNRQALLYYDKLLQWVSPEEEVQAYFDLLMRKANMLELLGRWSEGELVCRKAEEMSRREADALMKARASNALGRLLMLQGKYEESAKYLLDARQLFDELDDLKGKVKAYGNLGNLYFRQGAYEEAKSYFIRSIALSRKQAYSSAMAQVVSHLGLAFMNQGNYAEGVRWLKEQLSISQKEGDRQGMASLHVNLGIVLFEKGDYEEAKQHYEQGLALAEELSNKFLMAIALGSLGLVCQKQGKYDQARALYRRDLKLVDEMGDRQGRAITLLYMGELESLTGEYEEALEHLRESLEICKTLRYQKGIARAINTMGDVYYHQGAYEKALKQYEEAIRIAREISNLLVLSSSLYEKALTLEKMGRREEALIAAREGLDIAMRLHQEELQADLQTLVSRLQA